MNSQILRTAVRALEPLLILFSIFLLLAGHNEPGGGFVAGLVAASAFSLHALAYDPRDARRLAGADPRTLTAIGLLLALAAGIGPLAGGAPFLTGLWAEVHVPALTTTLTIGTPLLFDVGVYVLVTGVTLLMILTLAEE